MMKNEIQPEDFQTAEILFKQFVKEIPVLYRNPNFVEHKQNTFNVHLALHIVDNAKRWGPGWSVSGFPYENGNRGLGDAVEANRGIADQICRDLCKKKISDNSFLKKLTQPTVRLSSIIFLLVNVQASLL